jgi:hypothetical protein
MRCSLNISVIIEIEPPGWHNHTSASRQLSERVIRSTSYLGLDNDIVANTIALKAQMKVKTHDAIIAAIARVNEMTLVTGNSSYYRLLLREAKVYDSQYRRYNYSPLR